MSTYTKDSENIYFLNDKNIASSLIDDSVLNNAIPSHELFKSTYDGLSTYDNNLCIEVYRLNDKANTISSSLCTEVSSLSNTADEKFVLKTGDTISKLSVDGELKVSNKAVFEDNVELKKNVIIGKAAATKDGTFVWNGTESDYIAKEIDGGGGSFSINPVHGIEGMFIGDKSLCSYISEDIELTATDIRKEIDAVNTLLTANYALYADVSAVSKLTNDSGYLVSNDFDFKYDSGNKAIWLNAGNKTISVDATNFIIDGMLNNAEISTGTVAGDSTLSTYYLVLTFNTYVEGELSTTKQYVDLKQLIDTYEASEDGIKLDGNTFKLDFDVVGKKSNVDQLSGQIKDLCSNVDIINGKVTDNINHIGNIQNYINIISGVDGTFEIIKDDIEDLSTSLSNNVIDLNNKIENNATFAGHLQITKNEYEKWWNKEATYHLSTFLEKTNSTIFRKLKNGDIYCIEIEDINENDPFILEKSYIDVIESDRTGKTIRLAHKDYIVIHKHNIETTEITYDNVHNYVEIIPSVRFYELFNLSVTVSSDYVWLSGGNSIENNHAISGDNYFLGRNDIEDLSVKTLSVDWNNVKHPTGYSLYDLSVALSNKIYIDDQVNSDINGTSDLSIVKISKTDYDNTVALETTPLSANVLYVVDSDYIDAYGQVMKNLKMTNDENATEATNKHYVDELCTSLSNTVVLSVGKLQDQVVANDNDIRFLSGQHDWLSVHLSTDLSNETDTRTKNFSNLQKQLTEEITRAKAAESVNASAIKTISDNYLKKSDKTELQNSINSKANSTELTNYIQKTVIANALKGITADSELTAIANALTAIYNTIK